MGKPRSWGAQVKQFLVCSYFLKGGAKSSMSLQNRGSHRNWQPSIGHGGQQEKALEQLFTRHHTRLQQAAVQTFGSWASIESVRSLGHQGRPIPPRSTQSQAASHLFFRSISPSTSTSQASLAACPVGGRDMQQKGRGSEDWEDQVDVGPSPSMEKGVEEANIHWEMSRKWWRLPEPEKQQDGEAGTHSGYEGRQDEDVPLGLDSMWRNRSQGSRFLPRPSALGTATIRWGNIFGTSSRGMWIIRTGCQGPQQQVAGVCEPVHEGFVLLKFGRYTFNKDAQTLTVPKGEAAEETK